ncbi:MAG: choice-of-anchor J domain-containing protein [Paludibacteraceae bacterium]
MKTLCVSILLSLSVALMAQTATTLTVHVTPAVGNSVAGVRVSLSNEEYGLVYPEKTLTESGEAVFSNVLTTPNILVVNGEDIGLEQKIDTIEVTQNMRYEVVLGEQTRQPYALRADLVHNAKEGTNAVMLTWNREFPVLEDDFESYEAFAIDFAPWTGIDGDHAPTAQIQGSYPNAQLEQYATIFNPLTIEPSVWYEYPVLRPYSGAQYAAFITTADGTPNDDYLISPRLHIGRDFVLRFMAKAADRYNERFRVGIAANLPEGQQPVPSDFRWLTAGNYQTVDYREWQRIQYSLEEFTNRDVYICINYVSEQTFMLMVDDCYVGPSDNAGDPLNDYEKHIVLIDGDSAGSTVMSEFLTSPLSAGNHRFGVYSSYRYSHTDTIWTELHIPGDTCYAALEIELQTNNGEEIGNLPLLLSNDSTHEQYRQNLSNGVCYWKQLPLGDYTINVEKPYFLPLQASVRLTRDTTVSMTLIERIIRPYNLYVDITRKDTLCKGQLFWNRDLGFHDSFEYYEPFTQQFDNWTTLDLDSGVNYAIGLGGATIQMGEFGFSGQSSAMIFNPYETTPAVDADTYFWAYDGIQYVVFFSPQGGQADDWLICKPLEIGHDWVIRYWGKAYSEQYPETIEVMARRHGNTTGDFLSLGQQVFKDGEWAQYEVALADYEETTVEVAFHYISRDMWFAQLDDVYIGPRTSTDTEGKDVGHAYYEVYLDDEFLGQTEQTQYDLGALSIGKHSVAVQAIYRSGQSEKVTHEFEVSATAICNINTETLVGKYLRGNRLVIRRGQNCYDILGNQL